MQYFEMRVYHSLLPLLFINPNTILWNKSISVVPGYHSVLIASLLRLSFPNELSIASAFDCSLLIPSVQANPDEQPAILSRRRSIGATKLINSRTSCYGSKEQTAGETGIKGLFLKVYEGIWEHIGDATQVIGDIYLPS